MTEYRYPKDLVAPLRSGWHEWYMREMEAPPLPDDDTLLHLLETAYHASFTLDEQRRTRLALVVCNPEDAYAPLPFNEPRPFSVHELMRLGPVASPSVVLGVTRPEPGASPRIWGLCSSAYMQLTISVLGPGALEVGRNNMAHVALRGGHMGGETGGGAYGALADFLRSANTAIWEGVTFAGGSWSPEEVVYPRYVMGIATAIARAGHGGAVLIIPESDAGNFLAHPDWLGLKYSCDDDSLWPQLADVIRGYDEASDETAQTRARIAEGAADELLDRVARLAAVDGAVLLTDRLRILGFGAEVTVQSRVTEIVRSDGRVSPIEDFGTRHRSAFRFCKFYPAGLALVCSQDGGVKAVRCIDGTVRLFGG